MTNAVTMWENKEFSSELVNAKRIFPSTEMEGFFVAKIRKTKSNFAAFWDV
jgi:hypothetical protein